MHVFSSDLQKTEATMGQLPTENPQEGELGSVGEPFPHPLCETISYDSSSDLTRASLFVDSQIRAWKHPERNGSFSRVVTGDVPTKRETLALQYLRAKAGIIGNDFVQSSAAHLGMIIGLLLPTRL
jgi:hypothetical protein